MEFIKLKKLIIALGVFTVIGGIPPALANQTVEVTASTVVSNIPAQFSLKEFTLMRAWEFDWAPGFQISATPATQSLSIDPNNTWPTLRLTSNEGLTWFYYCNGLTLKYSNNQVNTAQIAFSGMIDATQPGGKVQCTCTGSTCSTTKPVTAVLIQQ